MYANAATLSGLLDGSWMQAGHQDNQAVIRSLGIFSPTPYPPERGEGLDTELRIDHAYVRKPP